MRITNELTAVLNNLPVGLSIYRLENGAIYPVYHNEAFFDVMGYLDAQRAQVEREDEPVNIIGIHEQDEPLVKQKIQKLLEDGSAFSYTCRIFNYRLQTYRYIYTRGAKKQREDGVEFIYGVFRDVTDEKQMEIETAYAQEKLNHLINSIPGGVGSYRMEGDVFKAIYISDGVVALSGYSREEYEKLIENDVINLIYEGDRERVIRSAKRVVQKGEDVSVSCRIRKKNGEMIWVHLNGRPILRTGDAVELSVVITGMSEETRLFQNIVNETVDGIYVIDKNSYDLLYVNESKALFTPDKDSVGKKCYKALQGNDEPCSFCTLGTAEEGNEHVMMIEGEERTLLTHHKPTQWNGIPAYIKYVRDITEEEKIRHEKQRLERYFQTLVNKLPGGVAVFRYQGHHRMKMEFISDGFATMTNMTLEQAWDIYRDDVTKGVHPDDRQAIWSQLEAYIKSDDPQCELVYRIRSGENGYIWIKCALSVINVEGEDGYVYAVYHDMTAELDEKERIRTHYNELIVKHYQARSDDTMLLGHCNITRNTLLDVQDFTRAKLAQQFGADRETFFIGLSTFVVDEKKRAEFLNKFLNKPALEAFRRGETELSMVCFVQLFGAEHSGRYGQIVMNMIETPDSDDVTGILTLTDVTERVVSEKIMRQVSITSYDFVADVNIFTDEYTVLSRDEHASYTPAENGRFSEWVDTMRNQYIVQKDREIYGRYMGMEAMLERLEREGSFTFAFSVKDENGNILTKNTTVTPIDLRIGRVCLVRADITDSVQEQRGLLNMLAYTFEIMAYISVSTGSITVHTRDSVLQNLTPYVASDYNAVLDNAIAPFVGGANEESDEEIRTMFTLETMIKRLTEKPAGYDFLLKRNLGDKQQYKQFNILWSDENHHTVCMVRADVTDILDAEIKSKQALEEALVMAKEASRAKSDFLSSMSHDIRTPMNAIMGMTAIALAHQQNPDRVKDCLQKISVSSSHLLSLINDILDMSKIEHSQITLNRQRIVLSELVQQLKAIIEPQAKSAGLHFDMQVDGEKELCFYGDALRINQVLLNLLGNAVKFTHEGGRVSMRVEETASGQNKNAVKLRFIVSDSGIGMSEDFIGRMFEPFARDGNVERIEGTGLGLSITKGLVELMGGTITVRSTVGVGSEFTVELECERAQEQHASTEYTVQDGGNAADDEKTFEGRCFLVAEDNAINAEILCDLLKLYGGVCVVKEDGAKTVHEFCEAPPNTYDAILMDIQMPVMNGYEATRAIRGLNRADAKTIPILAMTANAFAEDVRAALEAGMNAHMAKPINIKLLKETLLKELHAK